MRDAPDSADYPSEGQYGHKKNDLGPIFAHIPPGTKTLAEPFGGTGVVAWRAKAMGLGVMTNDVMAFAHLRQKVFVENDGVTLDEADIRVLSEQRPGGSRAIGELYGRALGDRNAAFLDGIASSLSLLDCPTKRDVAVCLAVLCVMRHMVFPAVKFGADGAFSGRRSIKGAYLGDEFRKLALERFPGLLPPGGRPCRASRMDALEFVAQTECDVLYLDPPYPSPGGGYASDLAFYDKLVHLLQGRPDLVGRPHTGLPVLPPHTSFTSRRSALMGIKLLFRAARNARRVIFSFNSTATVRPHEILRAARDWYGGLAACEWTPGRRPTSSNRRRKTTANVLMVFDRDRPTASPKWTPGEVTFADLIPGGGGFRAALQGKGWRCVFASQIDGDKCTTRLTNENGPLSGDIRVMSPDDVPEHQMLCASFPTSALGLSGKNGSGDDAGGMLFYEIPRIAAIRRPCVLLLENVSGFTSPDEPWLLLAKETLEGAGYRVFWQVIDVGLFFGRTSFMRTYLVCFRHDLGIASFDFPIPPIERVITPSIFTEQNNSSDANSVVVPLIRHIFDRVVATIPNPCP